MSVREVVSALRDGLVQAQRSRPEFAALRELDEDDIRALAHHLATDAYDAAHDESEPRFYGGMNRRAA